MGGGALLIIQFSLTIQRAQMEKTAVELRGFHSDHLGKSRPDASAVRTALEEIRREIVYTEALVISTLPRGSLQITQPHNLSDSLLKAYSREFHAKDRLTWQVMLQKRALRLSQAWPDADLDSIQFYAQFLMPEGFKYGIAAPLAGPVLDGYPGAIHLYRNVEQGDFLDDDLEALAKWAREFDRSIHQLHESRPAPACNSVLPHTSPVRQFGFDGQLRPRLWPDSLEILDSRLRDGMLADARQRLEHVNGRATVSDRVPLADSRGDLWNFRVVVHRTYPALGEGPFVFFCQQPECKQWGTLRAVDFQADPEIARLVPALKYMQEHFSKGPTLVNIAKTVHLSPFHFHRRFTELLGITPKHFLLDCQIEDAKRMLAAREKSLAEIAIACGFAHQSHFTSRFKQATGLTPTRWRRLATESMATSAN
jgi:AraC-like DNA-binding protein